MNIKEQIREEFKDWKLAENSISRTLKFKDFKTAISFMVLIAFEAEKLNHHPDWSNAYNTLEINLTTHDAGGLTEKDIKLAKIIDAKFILFS